MVEVLIRHVYSAFVAYSRCSVALWLLQPITDSYYICKFSAMLGVNDLSHSSISARRYAISGPLLWYISPATSDV